jgi:predicted secreted Zn-dependent protease
MSDTHEQIKLAFATYIKEIENFEENGVKVSAVRARQALNDLKKLIPNRRQEIQQMKNDL